MDHNTIQMKYYQCHKKVWALKILEVDGLLLLLDGQKRQIVCNKDMFTRYTPIPGDYYVDYGDYQSISPKEVFEQGYTLIEA